MIKKLSILTKLLYNQKGKKYTITHDGLVRFNELPTGSRELLLKLLTLIDHKCDVESFIFKVKIQEIGYSDHSNFYRARKPLIDREFIFCENGKYIVNPDMINYYSRRQLDYVYKHFKIKKEIEFVWK